MLSPQMQNTRLVQWVLNTLGSAFGWLFGAPAVGGVIAAWTGEPAVVAFGGLLGVIGFVSTLRSASAPLPYDNNEIAELADGSEH